MNYFIAIMIGLVAGLFSGLFGVGGGVILIPGMVLLLGLTQQQAQGTSLAVMMLPVFVLAVWKYYQNGNVNIWLAIFLAMGFVFGSFWGATFVQNVSGDLLRRAFAVFLILVAIKLLLTK